MNKFQNTFIKHTNFAIIFLLSGLYFGCSSSKETGEDAIQKDEKENPYILVVEAESFHDLSNKAQLNQANGGESVTLSEGDWLAIDAHFEEAGRYRVEVMGLPLGSDTSEVWVEDYYDNPDGRTYDVTGKMTKNPSSEIQSFSVEGSPFNKGLHKMKVHVSRGTVDIDNVVFSLIKPHKASQEIVTQDYVGDAWELVWSDEFDGTEIDQTKWTYDFGNWGWGNNELQYYTDNRPENARIEDGVLVIEARKGDLGNKWTSARLTTRGNVAFLYGKIEFRAWVPRERGNWAAGWTLGNSYIDEKDWPYSGEIDILESVGYEVDDETGDGIAHATVHTPAYYFKIGNQISNTKDVSKIAAKWHTYAVEWTPTEINILVDDVPYYLYDKTANEKEWPFNIPQNIILNLAMGGGWGGAQGLDPNITSQKFLIDYVRVFQKK
ncbi:family 16 glycosylhydrolase [Aquiflexum sp.]|uniref:glycoside hydrolase family 16 protein n=1 Tax=Aquiflexum sp. TaxID=1872584 RepID=UPI003593CEE0